MEDYQLNALVIPVDDARLGDGDPYSVAVGRRGERLDGDVCLDDPLLQVGVIPREVVGVVPAVHRVRVCRHEVYHRARSS